MARLGNVAEIVRDGIAPEKIVAGTPYLGLEHIESGGRIISSEPVANGELASTKFQFGPEHLLYGKLRPYLAKIALPDFAGICSTDILPVKAGPDLDKRYLAYFLRQQRMIDFANSRSTGANLPRLSPKALADFQVPLPPLPEQRRIAGILDQADALRRLRRQSLSRLSDLGQAIFYEMFGDDLPRKSLKELARVVTGGTPPTAEKGLFGGDIPFVTPGDLGSGEPVVRTLTRAGAQKSKSVRSGSTLVCCIGATIGKMDRAKIDSTFNQQINAIEWSDEINDHFGYYAVQELRNKIIFKGKGASTTLPILKKSEFEKLTIKVPAKQSQVAFAKRVEAMQDQLAIANLAVTQADSLFASLQHRAFRGEL